ncbi:MAG TPA: TonB-dependent receptor plug domain-containing protein [Thermoanaerobaculia bacterium]|nr:TonB-dependent receptor plug domain-containing protein [Thermoanaerobaculia bacterium]
MAAELPLKQARKHRFPRSRPPVAALLAAVCLAVMAGTSRAAEPPPADGPGAAAPGTLTVYDEIKVSGRDADLLGVADSASEGVTGRRELELRPLLRAGEVLETVPGVVITQHSGGGKANQYFLRGFNLDHGTDFRITVDDIPVNMPSHGHGQGYSDLNFLIPELIDTVRYKKGLYYADEGDFSAVGAATITYVDTLDRGLVQLAPGGGGYRRALVADSLKVAGGELLGGLEYLHEDGPWRRPDDYKKGNGIVRFHAGDAANGLTLTAMGYDGRWRSSDQIPLRAVREGLLGRFGEVDPSDGGASRRFSLAAELRRGGAAALTTFSAYALDYSLRLFSNFTYFLEDPVHGDQVRAKSADVGVRTALGPRLQTAVTFFQLDLASELVFSGDAGTTQAGRPSRRRGVELQSHYRPLAWAVDRRRLRRLARPVRGHRPGGPAHPGSDRDRPVGGGLGGRRRQLVRQRALALLRTTAAGRRRRRALAGDVARLPRSRLSLPARSAPDSRGVQPPGCARQRRRLFLCLAPARRAGTGQRHPLPSRRTPLPSPGRGLAVLATLKAVL